MAAARKRIVRLAIVGYIADNVVSPTLFTPEPTTHTRQKSRQIQSFFCTPKLPTSEQPGATVCT